jgi:hypothetical protein
MPSDISSDPRSADSLASASNVTQTPSTVALLKLVALQIRFIFLSSNTSL